MARYRRLQCLARRTYRPTAVAKVRAELVKEVEDNDAVLVLQWDGKLMTNVDGEAARGEEPCTRRFKPSVLTSEATCSALPPGWQRHGHGEQGGGGGRGVGIGGQGCSARFWHNRVE